MHRHLMMLTKAVAIQMTTRRMANSVEAYRDAERLPTALTLLPLLSLSLCFRQRGLAFMVSFVE
jgi:hypothetical protein